MADSGIPDKLLPALRMAVFWVALPFIFFLIGVERYFSGTAYEVVGCFASAVLSIVVAVYWERLLPKRLRTKSARLGYLRDHDSDLGPAIRDMVSLSAWGKWYAAQYLAKNDHQPADEGHLMGIGTHIVRDALMDGRLQARGRRPGKMEYAAIPSTHWRSTA